MDLAPNALTQDAQGVLSAISRHELVNLYVVSHTDRVTGRIKYVNREIETLQTQCAAEMANLYRSLFLAVDERVMAAGATIRAAMTAVGVQVDEVGGGFYVAPDGLKFFAEYIKYPDDQVYGCAFRNGREVKRAALHELVTEVMRSQNGIATDGKHPWVADVVLFRTGKYSLQEVCRVELPMVHTIQPTEKMRALYGQLSLLHDEIYRLRESIKDVPAMERIALAELTRRSLEAQGIKLEVPLLEIGGGVR